MKFQIFAIYFANFGAIFWFLKQISAFAVGIIKYQFF